MAGIGDGAVGASPAGDPSDPGNLGGMGMPTGLGANQGPEGAGLPGTIGPTETGLGGGPTLAQIPPSVAAVAASTQVKKSPKVEEAKGSTVRRSRRRTLLSDEEGGLEAVPIYRRSILGS